MESNLDAHADVIIIGGGPAGMMAAISAATQGGKKQKIVLFEKNNSLGKKLLITGGGRCNVTNSEFDIRKFLAHYKDSDKFLFSAFSQYGVKETLEFFHTHDMPTKVENEGRTFPISDSARSVYDVLVNEMKRLGVEVMTNVKVEGFAISKTDKGTLTSEGCKGTHIDGVNVVVDGKKSLIVGTKYVLATGGTSHPETGSTGDAYPWLRELGHDVHFPRPVLVPVTIKEKWVKDLQGISIDNVKLSVVVDKEKLYVKKGKVLFTHFGVTGPTILNMSKKIADLLDAKKKVFVHVDLLPEFDHGTLNQKLQDTFAANKSKKIKNTLGELVKSGVVNTILDMAKVSVDAVCSQVTREERMALIDALKNLPMTVTGLLGEDKAIIASGGVPLKEIDFKTMRSRVCDNLCVVGDLLDIDRPSGGYSLQLCWTTGFVAGRG